MDNIKFMIHTYPKRLWYVNDFLIPDLIRQGVNPDDIIVWNDEEKLGNLKSWVKSCLYVKENLPHDGGCWHLQDDVLLSRSFYKRIQDINPNIVNEGFISKTIMPMMSGIRKVGICSYKDSWLSFQCIYIPNWMLDLFYDWFVEACIERGSYSNIVSRNCLDDYLFWRFYGRKLPHIYINNIAPNLVNHIDYLMGGSLCSADRVLLKGDIALSYYWDEEVPGSIDDVRRIIWQDQESK